MEKIDYKNIDSKLSSRRVSLLRRGRKDLIEWRRHLPLRRIIRGEKEDICLYRKLGVRKGVISNKKIRDDFKRRECSRPCAQES